MLRPRVRETGPIKEHDAGGAKGATTQGNEAAGPGDDDGEGNATRDEGVCDSGRRSRTVGRTIP